jgi:hypothetical protein
MTTKTMPMTFAAGSAMPGFEGNFAAAAVASGSAVSWRQVETSVIDSFADMSVETFTPVAVANSAAASYAQHQASPVKPAALPTHTMRHTVTTKDAGRGNKGSSPWRFPV